MEKIAQIEHRAFLKKNKIDKKLLLSAIQDEIKIFDKMHDLLGKITPCGKGGLVKQLEKLDTGIPTMNSQRNSKKKTKLLKRCRQK